MYINIYSFLHNRNKSLDSVPYLAWVNLCAVTKAVSTLSELMQKWGNRAVTKMRFYRSEWCRKKPQWQSNTDEIRLRVLQPNTQNKKWKHLMMLSELWASFPSQTGATGAACGVRLPAQARPAATGPGLAPTSPAPCPLLPCQPAVLSFLTLCARVWLCSFCSSVKTNWEVWGETDKPAITEQSQQEEMAPCWLVGAFVQGGEKAPRADNRFPLDISPQWSWSNL